MSSTTKSELWTENAQELLSHPILNFCTKRRIPISLIGFTSLACYNLLIRRTVPLNPFDYTDWQAALAIVLLVLGLATRSWSAGSLNKSRDDLRDDVTLWHAPRQADVGASGGSDVDGDEVRGGGLRLFQGIVHGLEPQAAAIDAIGV